LDLGEFFFVSFIPIVTIALFPCKEPHTYRFTQIALKTHMLPYHLPSMIFAPFGLGLLFCSWGYSLQRPLPFPLSKGHHSKHFAIIIGR
jgi:hypothetical protein